MPSRRANGPIDTALCRRCQDNSPILTIRNEPLCNTCFHKYVSTKVVKRLESFRVRHSKPGQEPTLLLPLSFGAGSNALLCLLSQHLKGQVEKTGRTGFKLLILHVDDASLSEDHTVTLGRVKHRYPEHKYISPSLFDIFSLEDFTSLLADNNENEIEISQEATNAERFQGLISSLGSATSRRDAIQILKRRLIVHVAKQHSCEAVLWGDSTTKLAERTLAETAKGRGFSLPWIVADGESPYGVQFYYPMRELLSKEIRAFVSAVELPLDELIVEPRAKPAVSTKHTTIDDLMEQYFQSVEREYPSIVANVVRTAGKLQPTPLSVVEQQCELCEMPLEGQSPERSRLCYGCIRACSQAVK